MKRSRRQNLLPASLSSILLSTCLLLNGPVNANEITDQQVWGQFTLQSPLDSEQKWIARFDSHTRFGNDAQKLDIGILQASINYQYQKKLALGMGLDRMTFHRDFGDIIEERLWEQASYPVAFLAGGKLTARTRIEHRQHDFGNIGHRARQLLRWSRPLGNSPWNLVVANELFMNINDTAWGQDSGVDQNFTQLGANYRFSEKAKVEMGYVQQRLNRDTNQLIHAFNTQLFYYF